MIVVDNTETRKADLAYVREAMGQNFLGREEEVILALAWRDMQDEQALHRIIEAHTRLVVSMALRFRRYGLPIGDLIQEGNIGLLQAAARFDPQRNVRFSSYAKWWIRSSIQDYVLRHWSIVRTGSTTNQKQLFFNLRRLRAQLENVADMMSEEQRQDIADTLRVSVEDVAMMEGRLARKDLSLNMLVHQDGSTHWVDTIVDDGPTPEMEVMDRRDAHAIRFWLRNAMRPLDSRERQVIRLRHLSDPQKTLATTGEEIGVSKERVRQIEGRAIRKMRHHLINHIRHVRDVL